MRNNLFLLTFLFTSFHLIGQVEYAKGIELIGVSAGKTSFLFLDRNNILWKGRGSMNSSGNWLNEGLMQLKDTGWKTVYTTGIFTDALEVDTLIYFTTFEGLYKYESGRFSIDYGAINGTCIESFQHKIMVGTIGNGLFEKTNTGFKNYHILIDGKSYDSIYCMVASGEELWIGTSKGLVLFDGNHFSKFDLPYRNYQYNLIVKNQQMVRSVQKDVDGKIWVVNNNNTDSIDCLYFMDKGQFINARDYYSQRCMPAKLLPHVAKVLELNKKGHLILATYWGIMELDKDSIHLHAIINVPIREEFANFIYKAPNGDVYSNIGISNSITVKMNIQEYSDDLFKTPAKCAYEILDINEVKTSVTNVGLNFNSVDKANQLLNIPVFKIPSISCASPVFSASIWMGGTEVGSGNLHIAAETYRKNGYDYKPGPVDLITHIYDSLTNIPYNRLWKINRQTIDDFKANRTKSFYIIPKEILDWPAHGTRNFSKNLAPFVDVDHNGLYEPTKGDYPQMKGDQMLWWVFNDLGKHGETGGQSIGVEIHGSCYAYSYKDLPESDTNSIINRTIFFDYKIINRSNKDYENFYAGLWNDPDLGYYGDDYLTCDTLDDAGICYNADNYDEGPDGYGKNPPIFYCKSLNQKMVGFIYYNNNFDPYNGNPDKDTEYYNYLQSKLANGAKFQYYDNIKGKFITTKYVPADSVCKESNSRNNPTTNSPADRRFIMSFFNPSFKKDSIYEIEFAYFLLYDPDKDYVKDDCNKGYESLRRLQNWYNHNSFPSRPYYGLKTDAVQTSQQRLLIYPNPSHTILNLKAGIENKDISSIEIMDNSGRLVYQANNSETSGPFFTTIDIRSFASGIYLVKINTNNGVMTGKVILE